MSNTVPTYADFIAQYPLFIPPAVLEIDAQRQLDLAARLLSKGAWDDWYSDAILLVAAHNLSMWLKTQSSIEGGTQFASGNVSSVSGAGLSVSFESIESLSGSKSDAWHNRTVYGQQYLHLRSIVITSATLSF